MPSDTTGSDENKKTVNDVNTKEVNFLKLADGSFMVKNTTFHLSSQASKKMSVQCFQGNNSSMGTKWIDGGTNVSAMGRAL